MQTVSACSRKTENEVDRVREVKKQLRLTSKNRPPKLVNWVGNNRYQVAKHAALAFIDVPQRIL